MFNVGCKLTNKQQVAFRPHGPGGGRVGLVHGAHEGFMVSIYNDLALLDGVLELLDRGSNGEELLVEGCIAGLHVS